MKNFEKSSINNSDVDTAPGLEAMDLTELSVPSEHYLKVPYDSPHLGEHAYRRADGQEMVADIVLQIQADDVHVDLVHHGGRYGLVQVDPDGNVLRARPIDKYGRASLWASDSESLKGTISVQEDNSQWVISHSPVPLAGGDILPAPVMTVTSKSSAELSVSRRYKNANERQDRAEWWKRRARQGVGAMALYGVFMSGGGLDAAMDPLVSSDRAIERVYETIDSAMWDEDSILDGLPVKKIFRLRSGYRA